MKSRAMVSCLLGTMDCMTLIYASIYFKYLAKDSLYWEGFSALQNCVVLILAALFLPESPKWLYEKGHLKEAKKILIQIAYLNGHNGESLSDISLSDEIQVAYNNSNTEENEEEDTCLVPQ